MKTTDHIQQKKLKHSNMVSFRLPIEYIAKLESLSSKYGISKSEILRKGIDMMANVTNSQIPPIKKSF